MRVGAIDELELVRELGSEVTVHSAEEGVKEFEMTLPTERPEALVAALGAVARHLPAFPH